jgi:Lon-like protease
VKILDFGLAKASPADAASATTQVLPGATEAGMVLVQQALGNRRIRDLMSPEPDTVAPGIPVSEFLDEIVRTRGHSTYPVVEGDRPIGLVSLKQAGQVPREERPMRSVRDVMVPIDQIPMVAPETEMLDAIDDLQETPRRALVTDNGRLVGIVSISDVARMLEIEQAVGPQRERPARRAGFLVWAVVGLTMLLAAGALYHPPVVIVEPGVMIDVSDDITIRGAESEAVTGDYLIATVELARRNALGVLVSAVSPGHQIVSTTAVLPPGVDPEEFAEQQRAMFEQSRLLAAAAAAQAVGFDVGLHGEGAVVEEIVPGSPAADVLQSGDTILEIDGREIEIAQDVQSVIRGRPAGTDFDMTIERDEREQQVAIRSARLPEIADGQAGIGVLLSTRGFDVELPFEIDFERGLDVGGPSAGLTYALLIADMLDERDYARGRTIAATGEIGIRGDVTPVGGVASKAVAAEDAGADIFFVPGPQVDEATAEIEVRGVGSLTDALGVLSQS